MPDDKLETLKRLQEYLNLLNSVDKSGLSDDYIQFVQNLVDFNNYIQQQYQKDPESNEYKKLGPEEILMLQGKYSDILGSANDLLNKENCNSSEKDFNVLVSFVSDILEEDNDIIQKLDSDAKISLPDAVKAARSYVLHMDDEAVLVEKEGMQVIPVEFTDKGNVEKKGFLYDLCSDQPDGQDVNEKQGKSYAVSKIGEVLGLRNSLPKSEIVQIRVNGKLQDKCFVSDTKGSDINELKKDDILASWADSAIRMINDSKSYRPAVSNEGLQQWFDLKALDVILGIKREPSDYKFDIKLDEEGKPVLEGVKGINNNKSFGLSTDIETGEPSINEISYVSTEMSVKISLLSDAQFKYMLSNSRLTDAQLNAACERLHKVQDALNLSYETYFARSNTELVPGIPKIMNKRSMDEINIQFHIDQGKGMKWKNSFTALADTVDKIQSEYKIKESENKLVDEPKQQTYQKARLMRAPNRNELAVIKDQLDAFADEIDVNTPMLHINRPAFRRMNNKLNEIRNRLANQEYKESDCRDLYQELNGLSQAYIDAKGTNPYRTYGKNRLDIARRLRDFAAERVETLDSAEYKINKKIEAKEQSFKHDLAYHCFNQKEYVRLVNIAKEDSSAMMPSLYKREYKEKADLLKNDMKRTLAEMIYFESLKGKASELNADQLDNSLRDTVVRDAVHEIVNSDVFKGFFKKLDGIKLYENGKNMDMPQLMEVVNKEYKSFEKSLANDKNLNKEEIQIKK